MNRFLPLLLLSFITVPGAAQRGEPPLTVLRTPDKVLPTGFPRVTGFYELRDGRVLVSDRGEEILQVADFASNQLVSRW